jgi:DNA adenine methylase
MLAGIHDCLAGVVVENLRWQSFLERYDRPGTLFYFDPPYWGSETDYAPGMFDREDFALLVEVLSRLPGRFILSINDRPEVRELFGRFQFEEAGLIYSVGGGKGVPARELIITDGQRGG